MKRNPADQRDGNSLSTWLAARSRRDRKSGGSKSGPPTRILAINDALLPPTFTSRIPTANAILALRELASSRSSSKFIACRAVNLDSERSGITAYRRAYKRELRGTGAGCISLHFARKEADACAKDANAPCRSSSPRESANSAVKSADSRVASRTKLNSCDLDEDLEECARTLNNSPTLFHGHARSRPGNLRIHVPGPPSLSCSNERVFRCGVTVGRERVALQRARGILRTVGLRTTGSIHRRVIAV